MSSKRARGGELLAACVLSLAVVLTGCGEDSPPAGEAAGADAGRDLGLAPVADGGLLDSGGERGELDLDSRELGPPLSDVAAALDLSDRPSDASPPSDLASLDLGQLPPDDLGLLDGGARPADGGGAATDCGAADGGRPDAGQPDGAPAADLGEPDAGGPLGWGPPYPIVLQHGWTGFEAIGPIEYFFNVEDHLEQHGFQVFVSEVAPYHNSRHRGDELAANIDRILAETGAAKVNVIAHSQGGIDTRYVISTLGYGDRIASLTTISTPHRGTRVGDAYLGLIPGWSDALATGLAWLIGMGISDVGDDPDFRESMWQVSEHAMIQFNLDNPDDPRVAYYSWAGRSFMSRGRGICEDAEVDNPGRVDACTAWLQATGRFVGESLLRPKPNDGLITVESARWGRFRGCIPADHIDEVGHIMQLVPDPLSNFNHLRFYLEIAIFLQSEGY